MTSSKKKKANQRCRICYRLNDRCICNETCIHCSSSIRFCDCECQTCEVSQNGCDCDRDDNVDTDDRLNRVIDWRENADALTITKTKAVKMPVHVRLSSMTDDQADAIRARLFSHVQDSFKSNYTYATRASSRSYADKHQPSMDETLAAMEQVMARSPLFEPLTNPDYVTPQKVLNFQFHSRSVIDPNFEDEGVEAVMSLIAGHRNKYDIASLKCDTTTTVDISSTYRFFIGAMLTMMSSHRYQFIEGSGLVDSDDELDTSLVGWVDPGWRFAKDGFRSITNRCYKREAAFSVDTLNEISLYRYDCLVPRLISIEALIEAEYVECKDGSMLYTELNVARSRSESGVAAFSGFLIEGIHYNRHRRHEIEHLIWTRPGRGRQADAADINFFSDQCDADFLRNNNQWLANSLDDMEVVIIGRMLIAYDMMHLISLLNDDDLQSHSVMQIESDERLRKSHANLILRRNNQLEAFTSLMNATADVRKAQLEIFLATYAKEMIGAHAENILKHVRENFQWITKTAFDHRTGLMFETETLYGWPETYADEDGTVKVPESKCGAYIGKFQILINPITAEWNIRNIAAPLAVHKMDVITRRVKLLHVPHPHSSPSDSSHSVCIGSYSQRLATLVRHTGSEEPIAPVAEMLAVLHSMLTTFNPDDIYVRGTLGTYEKSVPPITAVCRWYFKGKTQRIPNVLFGIRNTNALSTLLEQDVSELPKKKLTARSSDNPLVRVDTVFDHAVLKELHDAENAKWTN